MSEVQLPRDLLSHLSAVSALSPREAERLVREVLTYFDETTERYATRRHAELRMEGVANAQAFQVIADELREYPVRAPALSTRQVRRLIYG